ncbi:MAG TPA: hypothetical protein VM364_02200 [Vicinamibacterales bacterium]|nr:hypothetical protein [Vicinamibacterales bacterium]
MRILQTCAFLLVLNAAAAGSQATFNARVAVFEARAKAMKTATDPEARAAATLEWLRALRNVLEVERIGAAERRWLKGQEKLVAYNEPGGVWMIRDTAIWEAHDRVRGTKAADEIAWLAVEVGLGGECEGYVPCYAHRLNRVEGEYLRRHPQGRYVAEALQKIDDLLAIIHDDLLKGPHRTDFMRVPDDCAELLEAARPLRTAVAGVAHARRAKTLQQVDRLIRVCP